MSVPVDKTHWRDILGNPYQQSPNAEMLGDEGYIKTGYRGVRGESKKDTDKRFIYYDREYVVAFIMRKVIIPLGVHKNETKYNEFQKIISDAIKRAKEQN